MAGLGYPESVLVAYSTKGKEPAFIVPAEKQVWIYNARSFNNQGGSQSVGVCRKHVASQYKLWELSTGGTVYTLLPSDLSGSEPIFAGANNDAYIVQDRRRFNIVGFTISDVGAGGTFTYNYWNGSSFVALTTLEVPAYSSLADVWLAFRAPSDWVPGGPSQVDQDMYSIKVISTVTPSTSVEVSALWVAEFLEFVNGVPNNAYVQLSFPDSKPFLLNGGEGLFPYYTTAAAANQFGCYYTAAF